MFAVSVVLAGTDVAIDRATVIAGAEEAKATGRSRATVGRPQPGDLLAGDLRHAIVSAAARRLRGGARAVQGTARGLAGVPLMVLLFVLRLPRDTRRHDSAAALDRRSSGAGLNTGPVLGVMRLLLPVSSSSRRWGRSSTDHLMRDAALLPAAGRLRRQRRLRRLLRRRVAVRVEGRALAGALRAAQAVRASTSWSWRVLSLTQYRAARALVLARSSAALSRGAAVRGPRAPCASACCAPDSCVRRAAMQLVRMSTFSVVGAVMPVAAAGSLFAGIMSVTNLGLHGSYSSGAWLYAHGMEVGAVRGRAGRAVRHRRRRRATSCRCRC